MDSGMDNLGNILKLIEKLSTKGYNMAERNLKRVRLNLWFCTVSLALIDGLK